MIMPDGSINNGSDDDGLFPLCHRAISWTNADLLSIGPSGIDLNDIYIKNIMLYIQENTFESKVDGHFVYT